MNTKTFAQQSRRILIEGVEKKLLYWGFDAKGNVLETPQKVSGGYSFRGDVFDDPEVLHLWQSLRSAVQRKGIEVVIEEAAYTWFNRIMALRIMSKNGYEPALLINAEGLEHTPVLLQKARQGQYSFLNRTEQERLKKILGDYSKDQEAFSILLVGYCHSNTTLNSVFGRLDDYTELLLPDNMLQDTGFLHLLNTTDAISDEEYREVELIGWLYQFYISEKKDEVFASFKKGKKAEAKDIPAATQIFTPNWIVKYMVQNTAGKIWLDKNPVSPLKSAMKYLVENESDNSATPIIKDITELTLLDPAAGSGHILVEGFDLLYEMYREEYYTAEEAVELILKNNLFGLDIDDRAAQLATFAILLKAAKYYRDVFSKGWLPNVYAMPEEMTFSHQDIQDFLGPEGAAFTHELEAALRSMRQAKNLGSVMKLSLSEQAQSFIATRFEELSKTDAKDINLESIFQGLKFYIPVLLILTRKYAAVVANPPYMVSGKMNKNLKDYLSENYIETKGDLCTVFMDVAFKMLTVEGRYGMINQTSWMFKPSFTQFRKSIIDTYWITSLLHLGSRLFDELSGEVVQSTAFIINKSIGEKTKIGKYFDLENPKSSEEKRKLFDNNRNTFFDFDMQNIKKIQDHIIAYWLSKNGLNRIEESLPLLSYGDPRKGIASGDDSTFFRFWYEINVNVIKFDFNSEEDIYKHKWFPINKGGGIRKWSGNFETVVNWENDGEGIKNLKTISGKIKSRPQNLAYSFQPGITYNIISSKGFSGRMTDRPSMMSDVGPTIYNLTDENYILGLLISKVGNYYFRALCPGYKYDTGAVGKFPVIFKDNSMISQTVDYNVEISKKDWDSHETSWDFSQSPLLNETPSLKPAYEKWQEDATQDFFKLHANEEELNRIFIDIYGLQDELTPEVSLKDITILQDELNAKDLEKLESVFRAQGAETKMISLPIKKSEVISQFISYAIGLFMGRYRLDKPGLNIAHPNPTAEELENYSFNHGTVTIDKDAIIPLMGKNCSFHDDALHLINQLLDTIWGHETRTENTNFIHECLDKDLEKFLTKDFYKYHCSMYKKKPIYWLFSSRTSAFQVLVYMHRMNAFTVEKIRANYMLEHLKNLRSEESLLQSNAANLNTQQAKRLDQIRKDLVECEAYDMELKNVADQQITFDLDDGVTANYALFENVLAKIK